MRLRIGYEGYPVISHLPPHTLHMVPNCRHAFMSEGTRPPALLILGSPIYDTQETL